MCLVIITRKTNILDILYFLKIVLRVFIVYDASLVKNESGNLLFS